METKLQSYMQETEAQHLAELQQLLSIPSISALPEHKDDIETAAAWMAAALRTAGVPRVEVLPTGGAPAVFGHWPVADAAPTVIIYGHYDVQPVDPLHLWTSPPFTPTVREGRLYARGASDDKGNVLMPVKAVAAFRRLAGQPPLNIKFLIEGEEEIGSPHLADFMAAHQELLAADLAICADGSMWDHDTPSLTVGSKGLAGLQINVQGANTDLHSGSHGGSVQNPLHALAALLAGLRTADGKITVAGFYDRVQPLSAAERQATAAIPFDEEAYKRKLGVTELFGEPGFTTLERQWARPTIEVNGMWGGFQGTGVKTVLPNVAHAKITCRLVPDQRPEEILDLLADHLRSRRPPGVTISIDRFPGSAYPYLMPADHPALLTAGNVLAKVYNRKPLTIRMGGTLPVAELFQRLLEVYMVFYSFGGPDDRIHAPNESLPLASFRRGIIAHYHYLSALAQLPGRVLRGVS